MERETEREGGRKGGRQICSKRDRGRWGGGAEAQTEIENDRICVVTQGTADGTVQEGR